MARLSKDPQKIQLSQEKMNQIIDTCISYQNIIALYLFGSYGTEHQTPLSDVDLAILPSNQDKLSLSDEQAILATIQEIGGTDDINMINLVKVPITLQMEVISTGTLLYCSDEIGLADFKEYVIKRYCDFEPDLRQFNIDYDIGLRKEFL